MRRAGDLANAVMALIERRFDDRRNKDAGGDRHVWIDPKRHWTAEVERSSRNRRETEVSCPHCLDEGVTPLTFDGQMVRALCDCSAASRWYDADGNAIVTGYWAIRDLGGAGNTPASPAPNYTDPDALADARSGQMGLDDANAALADAEDGPTWGGLNESVNAMLGIPEREDDGEPAGGWF